MLVLFRQRRNAKHWALLYVQNEGGGAVRTARTICIGPRRGGGGGACRLGNMDTRSLRSLGLGIGRVIQLYHTICTGVRRQPQVVLLGQGCRHESASQVVGAAEVFGAQFGRRQ